MIRLLLIFLVLLASVWLGIQLNKDPGYVLISIDNWSIESTLWIGLLIAFIAFGIMYVGVALLTRISHGPAQYKAWRRRKQARKSRRRTRQGLIEFSEGSWSSALKNLIKALPNAETPLLNYLTAARAAQEMGDSTLRDKYLREAQQSMPEATVAVELTQAQLQLANKQWEQALATLRHLQDLTPNHPYVLKLLLTLYEEVRDWTQLIALLPLAKKHQIINKTDFRKLYNNACACRLKELIQNPSANQISEFVDNLPPDIRQQQEFIKIYTRYLCQQKKTAEAEQILKRAINKNYNPVLIDLFGQLDAVGNQLTFAQSLLKKHPHCAHLQLCCGRLAKKQQLWGKARHYLEESIQLNPMVEAYYSLGTLLETLHETEQAMIAYKAGLSLHRKQLSHNLNG